MKKTMEQFQQIYEQSIVDFLNFLSLRINVSTKTLVSNWDQYCQGKTGVVTQRVCDYVYKRGNNMNNACVSKVRMDSLYCAKHAKIMEKANEEEFKADISNIESEEDAVLSDEEEVLSDEGSVHDEDEFY